MLEEYIENQNEGVTVIFSVIANKLDDRKSIVKKIREKAKSYALDNVNKKDLPRVVRQMFEKKGVSITNDGLNEFINRCGDNMYLISNEIEKLSCYKKELELKDIMLMKMN